MNEGEKIFLDSIAIFIVVSLLFLGYGFFLSPKLHTSQEISESFPKPEVLSALAQQNPYAYGCLENSPVKIVPLDYETIQQAIDEVETGTIISVDPGVYVENLTLKPNLCLVGHPSGKTELKGTIEVKGNNHIRNFKIVGDEESEMGILARGSENVSIEANSFVNFKSAILVDQGSKVNITSNSFRDVGTGISLTDSFFFTEANNIEANETSIFVKDSEGEIIGKVLIGGDYGVRAENSVVFFNKNIFKNQEIAGLYLDEAGQYELGNNTFQNTNEDILYK